MIKITHPDQIPTLPWKGNFRDDQRLFNAVNKYIRSEPDPYKAYAAERHAHKYGMGMILPAKPSKSALGYTKSQYRQKSRRGL